MKFPHSSNHHLPYKRNSTPVKIFTINSPLQHEYHFLTLQTNTQPSSKQEGQRQQSKQQTRIENSPFRHTHTPTGDVRANCRAIISKAENPQVRVPALRIFRLLHVTHILRRVRVRIAHSRRRRRFTNNK